MDKSQILEIANREKNKKCIFCGANRVEKRRICKKCHSKQVAEIRRNKLIELKVLFECTDCWQTFPRYHKDQKRCRKCHLKELQWRMKERHKNNCLTISANCV